MFVTDSQGWLTATLMGAMGRELYTLLTRKVLTVSTAPKSIVVGATIRARL